MLFIINFVFHFCLFWGCEAVYYVLDVTHRLKDMQCTLKLFIFVEIQRNSSGFIHFTDS